MSFALMCGGETQQWNQRDAQKSAKFLMQLTILSHCALSMKPCKKVVDLSSEFKVENFLSFVMQNRRMHFPFTIIQGSKAFCYQNFHVKPKKVEKEQLWVVKSQLFIIYCTGIFINQSLEVRNNREEEVEEFMVISYNNKG